MMGTNYYYETKPCESCGHNESLHMGKCSGGWAFLFRGYRPDEDCSGPRIESLQDWLKFMEGTPGKLVDEYDRELSVEDFVAMVRGKQGEKSHGDGWVDAEGFEFWDREFF
jgi:hypothetical protein